MKQKKCYVTIYKESRDDKDKVWWQEFTNKQKAHEYAMLCRTYLENFEFKVKVINDLNKPYKNRVLKRLRESYITDAIKSLYSKGYIKGLRR